MSVRTRRPPRLPEEQQRNLQRAKILEYWTLAFLASVSAVMYLAMGGSQAMKTAFVEDLLSLVPPVVFLLAVRVRDRAPDEDFAYGHQRAVTLAFLCAAVALSGVGVFLVFDSVRTLVTAEHPAIGLTSLFGYPLWSGWVMIAALLYSVIPPVMLGRMKVKLARELHDKALYADAEMNRADWMTGAAGIGGIVGIGFGWWWADALAALVIALDVTRDGFVNAKRAADDLMDHRPRTVDRAELDPLLSQIEQRVRQLSWVKQAKLRFREEGQLLCGEVFVVPRDAADLILRLDEAERCARDTHWRVYDVTATAISKLD
ncbi:MAG TPA: cation diffusion facilitator family transporter [Polyangiaceae bacterium]|nr:cation diffusion facilitator family transporter [Polyangiaceae bacterium]